MSEKSLGLIVIPSKSGLETTAGSEFEDKEYDLLVDIVSPDRKIELIQAIAKAKQLFPHMGATHSKNDTLCQLIAFKGVFESFIPANHPRPVLIIQYEESTAWWILRYKSYFVYTPTDNLTHRVIKTIQNPQQGNPYLTLSIDTLKIDDVGIPEMETTRKQIDITKHN